MSDTNYSYWYSEGAVSCTKDSNVIRGTNTYWDNANIKPGDIFTVDGTRIYQVKEVNTSTQITLTTPYQENSFTGGSYGVIRNFTATLPAEIAAKVTKLILLHKKLVDEELATIQGMSAYDVAKENGFAGTETEWLASLTAYGVAKSAGYSGSINEWLTSITAYGQAVAEGFTGTRAQWLESLKAAGEWTSARDRLSTLESADTSKGQRITTLEGSSTDYGKRINALETSQGSQDVDITKLKSTDTTYGERITTLETTSTAYGGRIKQTEDTGTNHEGRITTLETTSGTHTQKITNLEADDTNHATRIGTLESNTRNLRYWRGAASCTYPTSGLISIGMMKNTQLGGNFLGSSITEVQLAQIRSAQFNDMYLGDFWKINDHIYTIAHFNYQGGGRIARVKRNEEGEDVTTMPGTRTDLGNVVVISYNIDPNHMSGNSQIYTKDASVGYYGSYCRTQEDGWLTIARKQAIADLGDALGYFGEYQSSALSEGKVTAAVCALCRWEWMSEMHVLGYRTVSQPTYAGVNHLNNYDQFALFKIKGSFGMHDTINTYRDFVGQSNHVYSYYHEPLSWTPVTNGCGWMMPMYGVIC